MGQLRRRHRQAQPGDGQGLLADRPERLHDARDEVPAGNPSGTIPTTPPTAAYAGDNLVITATGGTGQVTFTANSGNFAGTVTELLLQPLKSKNRTPSAKGYRSKAFKAFAGGSLSQVVSVPVGSYAAAYRYVNTATGQATPLVALPVLTVALNVEDGGLVETPVSRKKAA